MSKESFNPAGQPEFRPAFSPSVDQNIVSPQTAESDSSSNPNQSTIISRERGSGILPINLEFFSETRNKYNQFNAILGEINVGIENITPVPESVGDVMDFQDKINDLYKQALAELIISRNKAPASSLEIARYETLLSQIGLANLELSAKNKEIPRVIGSGGTRARGAARPSSTLPIASPDSSGVGGGVVSPSTAETVVDSVEPLTGSITQDALRVEAIRLGATEEDIESDIIRNEIIAAINNGLKQADIKRFAPWIEASTKISEEDRVDFRNVIVEKIKELNIGAASLKFILGRGEIYGLYMGLISPEKESVNHSKEFTDSYIEIEQIKDLIADHPELSDLTDYLSRLALEPLKSSFAPKQLQRLEHKVSYFSSRAQLLDERGRTLIEQKIQPGIDRALADLRKISKEPIKDDVLRVERSYYETQIGDFIDLLVKKGSISADEKAEDSFKMILRDMEEDYVSWALYPNYSLSSETNGINRTPSQSEIIEIKNKVKAEIDSVQKFFDLVSGWNDKSVSLLKYLNKTSGILQNGDSWLNDQATNKDLVKKREAFYCSALINGEVSQKHDSWFNRDTQLFHEASTEKVGSTGLVQSLVSATYNTLLKLNSDIPGVDGTKAIGGIDEVVSLVAKNSTSISRENFMKPSKMKDGKIVAYETEQVSDVNIKNELLKRPPEMRDVVKKFASIKFTQDDLGEEVAYWWEWMGNTATKTATGSEKEAGKTQNLPAFMDKQLRAVTEMAYYAAKPKLEKCINLKIIDPTELIKLLPYKASRSGEMLLRKKKDYYAFLKYDRRYVIEDLEIEKYLYRPKNPLHVSPTVSMFNNQAKEVVGSGQDTLCISADDFRKALLSIPKLMTWANTNVDPKEYTADINSGGSNADIVCSALEKDYSTAGTDFSIVLGVMGGDKTRKIDVDGRNYQRKNTFFDLNQLFTSCLIVHTVEVFNKMGKPIYRARRNEKSRPPLHTAKSVLAGNEIRDKKLLEKMVAQFETLTDTLKETKLPTGNAGSIKKIYAEPLMRFIYENYDPDKEKYYLVPDENRIGDESSSREEYWQQRSVIYPDKYDSSKYKKNYKGAMVFSPEGSEANEFLDAIPTSPLER